MPVFLLREKLLGLVDFGIDVLLDFLKNGRHLERGPCEINYECPSLGKNIAMKLSITMLVVMIQRSRGQLPNSKRERALQKGVYSKFIVHVAVLKLITTSRKRDTVHLRLLIYDV